MTIDEFFAGYVDAFNRSLGDAVDAEGIRRHFSSCFVGAGPQGVQCGQNDASFTEALEQGYAFYRRIGTRAMAVRSITSIPIDDAHTMTRVAYRASYEKPEGEALDLDFEVSYMLAAPDETYEIFAFVTGDERALYEEHGLLPVADAS
ncbi:MAG: nuclear transport factor 2 family protein [Chloroflexota bacterium]|nr:nuclear transport factor 2 family protein [Chloroflexota bacterium]